MSRTQEKRSYRSRGVAFWVICAVNLSLSSLVFAVDAPQFQSNWENPHGNAFRVRVQGNYAYVTMDESSDSLEIIDISDPKNPILLSRGPSLGGAYKTGLAVSGDYAYVGHNGYVSVINVADKIHPTLVKKWYSGANPNRMFLQIDGNFLYVGIGSKGMFVLDVSNPSSPIQVGFIATPTVGINELRLSNIVTSNGNKYIAVMVGDGTYLVNITNPANMSVTSTLPRVVQGYLTSTRFYSTEGYHPQYTTIFMGDRVFIRDITSPANPVLLNSTGFLIEPQGIDMVEQIRNNTRYLVMAARTTPTTKSVGGQWTYSGRSLVILNVEDPQNILQVGVAGPQIYANLLDPHYQYAALVIDGNYSYAATYYYGLDIMDISSFSAPIRAGGLLLSGEGRWITTKGNYMYYSDTTGGIIVLDISNPSDVRQVANVYTSAQYFEHSNAVIGNYLYAAGDEDRRIAVIDIQDPTHPKIVKIFLGARSRGLRAEINGAPYLVSFGFLTRTAFAIADVSDPLSPVVKSTVEFPVHEGTIWDALLDGNYLWVATPNGGIHVYDVTDKTNPQQITLLSKPLGVLNLSIVQFGAKRYLYTASNANNTPDIPRDNAGLFVYDITDPRSPIEIKHIYASEWTGGPDNGTIHAMIIQGNLLYMADYWYRLHIFDLTDPANPQHLPFGKIGWTYYPTGLAVTDNALYVNRIDGLGAFTLPGGKANQPPTVSLSATPTNGTAPLQVAFNVTAQDADGTIQNCLLNFGDGTSSIEMNPTHTYSNSGNYTAKVEVTDNAGAKASDSRIITVNPPANRAPVLDAIGNKNIDEGKSLIFNITASDPDGDVLTYSASSLPSGASFDSSNGAFSWTPSYTQAGNYSITFSVSDGSLSDSETITITVTDVVINPNGAPVLNPIGNKTIAEGSLLKFAISGTDPDGDALTYSASGLPRGAVFDAGTKTFSWTPGYKQAGNYSVTFKVSDGNLSDSETITITVRNTKIRGKH